MDIQHALQIALDHHRAGRLDAAIAAYNAILALAPDLPALHNNLGIALRESHRFSEALEAIHRAIELDPAQPQPYNSLASTLRETGDIDGAISAWRQALALAPDDPATLNNLAIALAETAQLDAAMTTWRRALSLQPDNATIHSNLLYNLHFHPGYDAPALLAAHRQWNQQHALRLLPAIPRHANDRSPGRALRLGLVSPDFRNHVVGRFLLPLLTACDRNALEISCYATLRHPPDALTHQLRLATDRWIDITSLSDADAAQRIQSDRIDILVDLSAHMAGNRLLLFARKPAPVQVSYLAYCSTTGLDAIDYRLTDPLLDPPSSAPPPYSEQSIRLPGSYWCYAPPPGAPPISPLPASTTGHITFGCLNTFRKVSPPAFDLWLNLLRSIPDSRLILHAPNGAHRQRLRDRLHSRGLDPARLAFLPMLPLDDYLRACAGIDIALDPFPCAGGTTTCDALFMGVPVITLAGRTAVGRSGASILTSIALPDLIARTPDHYLAIAASLAADLPRLASLRAILRSKIMQSPLADAPAFARAFESACRQMWHAYLAC